METDKHYFIEGLFIIGFAVAVALFAVWLVSSGNSDDMIYRIYFNESVSGLALGDPVKYQGVDVGSVKALAIDPQDPHKVRVDVRLRKQAPVKTDTKATLKLKGITGAVYIELNGGSASAPDLLAATRKDQLPEIPSEKSNLATVLDDLPKLLEKFSAIEDHTNKVVAEVGGLTRSLKENPSQLIWGPKDKEKERPTRPIPKQ